MKMTPCREQDKANASDDRWQLNGIEIETIKLLGAQLGAKAQKRTAQIMEKKCIRKTIKNFGAHMYTTKG